MFIQNARNIPKIQPLFSMNWYYFFKARISYLWLLEFCLPILDRFFVWKSLPLVSKGSHHLFEQGIIELVDLVTKIVHCMTEKKIFKRYFFKLIFASKASGAPHYKLRLIQIKFSFTVKTIDFWTYLKVFTGMKKKKSLIAVRKKLFGLLIFMYMK